MDGFVCVMAFEKTDTVRNINKKRHLLRKISKENKCIFKDIARFEELRQSRLKATPHNEVKIRHPK